MNYNHSKQDNWAVVKVVFLAHFGAHGILALKRVDSMSTKLLYCHDLKYKRP